MVLGAIAIPPLLELLAIGVPGGASVGLIVGLYIGAVPVREMLENAGLGAGIGAAAGGLLAFVVAAFDAVLGSG